MIDNLKDVWKKSYDESINSIDKLIKSKKNDGEDTSNFIKLAKWLLTNEHSPYDYMDSYWVGFKSNPYSTLQVLQNLHHAMVDDGDVSFVSLKINGEVKRVFMTLDYSYDNFNLRCIQENKTLIDSMINSSSSMFEMLTKLQGKHPEREIKIHRKLTMDDVKFEFHGDSNRFIKEFESFQEVSKIKRDEIDLRLREFRSQKP